MDLNRLSPKCVYWDYLTNGWASDGCSVVSTNATHTRCQCNHLTNFALVMTEGGASRVALRPALDKARGGHAPKPALPVVTERAFMSKNVSTIVAAVATLISFCVICFFAYMAWKKLKVSSQCRGALGKSGVLCFHKGKVSWSST